MRNPSEGCSQDQISGISPFGRNDRQVITDFVHQNRKGAEPAREILLMAYFGYRRYPPSILMISNHLAGTPQLGRKLKNHGCRVQQIKAGLEALVEVSHTFFDVIVLEIERVDRNVEELCDKLTTDRELATVPLVVVLPPGSGHASIAGLGISPPVQYLTWEAGVGTKLLQIIEEIHYLTDRYA